MMNFTGVFAREGDAWMAYAEEIPGANTQGATLDEARENLLDAVKMVLDANREIAREALKNVQVVKEQLAV
jgi:predicted RNase H-like HicB family nuclease